MEILTTVGDFPVQVKRYQFSSETLIRVIVEENSPIKGDEELPKITPEEQKRRLNLLSSEYNQGASEELIECTRELGKTE